jgi:hypothetical protein
MRLARIVTAGGLLSAFVLTAGAQAPDRPEISAASADWDRGEFVAALNAYKAILAAPGGDAWLEPIALRTGELFRTQDVTSDGASPRFSPDGRFVAYESGAGGSRRTVVVETGASLRVVTSVSGAGAAFAPAGDRLAYLRPRPSDELARAEAEAERDTRAGDVSPARLAANAQRLRWLRMKHTELVIRELSSGRELVCPTEGLLKAAPVFAADGLHVFFVGAREDDEARNDIFWMPATCGTPQAVSHDASFKTALQATAKGGHLVFLVPAQNAFRRPAPPEGAPGVTAGSGGGGRGGAGRGEVGGGATSFGVLDLKSGTLTVTAGVLPALSGDGSTLAYLSRGGDETAIMVGPVGGAATSARRTRDRLAGLAISPDGSHLAFQAMPKDDWEVFTIARDGSDEVRVTRNIEHDVQPVFVTNTLLVAASGEPRHLRSTLYDLKARTATRLFHNNTIRTLAPEYSWTPSADGRQILVVAERDGDTVSPERGVYLVPLDRRVTKADVAARLDAQLSAETALRAAGERMYRPIAAEVRRALAEVSVSRVYGYEKALFDFDSKHITKPGNRLASEYLFNTYTAFGYAPEYQWFEPRGAMGGKSANVVATLAGTDNPEIVYVVSSHYDSVPVGPGADDDSTGTSALLEAARVLARHPMPATIVFASFTGEESGLLGSREFVRRARERQLNIAGALNNDMIGWANDAHLDNTIRYSNDGIRDLQHGASFFTRLITYDARYYKGTDAVSYTDAYGNIVGGIGSYPVLSNPHYHQATDLLETINHELVAETSRVTVASLMLLASSPAPVKSLTCERLKDGAAQVSWAPSPEKGVTGYVVAYGPPEEPFRARVTVKKPAATLRGAGPGTIVSVKASNARGLDGWDWSRVTVR